MNIDDPNAKPPAKILAFDPAKDREPYPVDLDSPFFTIERPDYTKCDHRNRGVTLNTENRKATCLCGVEIDNFDALLLYAHAQRRLMSQADAIKAHYQKEADKKAAKPFVRAVEGFAARTMNGRVVGYSVRLDCTHEAYWDKRKPPRTMTCQVCVRNAKLKARGVAVAGVESA